MWPANSAHFFSLGKSCAVNFFSPSVSIYLVLEANLSILFSFKPTLGISSTPANERKNAVCTSVEHYSKIYDFFTYRKSHKQNSMLLTKMPNDKKNCTYVEL